MWLQNLLHYRRELWNYRLSDFCFVRKFLCPKYCFVRRIFCQKLLLLIVLKRRRENKKNLTEYLYGIPLKNVFNILKLTLGKMWLSCLPERFFAKKIYLNGFKFNVVALSIFIIFMQGSKISVLRICDYKTFRVYCFEWALEEKINELSLGIV